MDSAGSTALQHNPTEPVRWLISKRRFLVHDLGSRMRRQSRMGNRLSAARDTNEPVLRSDGFDTAHPSLQIADASFGEGDS